MDIEELKQIIKQVVNEEKLRDKNITRKKIPLKKAVNKRKLTATHKLILVATVMYFATWIVSVVSWFTYRVIPEELLKYGTCLYGAAFGAYTGKSAYEYGKRFDPNFEEQDGA